MSDSHKFSPQDLEPLLAFLPILAQEDFIFGEWQTPEDQTPHFEFSPQALALLKAAQPVLIPFDWIRWQKTAEDILNDPEKLARADLLTLRKLLTTFIRMDRFVEGCLNSLHQQGQLAALLARIDDARHAPPPDDSGPIKHLPPYQTQVEQFVQQHNLSTDLETRLLDLLSELGEVAKEALKSTNYGQNPFMSTPEWEVELGDLFFSLICIANSTGIHLESALDKALVKYVIRLYDTDSPASGE